MTKAWPVENVEPDGDFETNARRILAVRIAEFYSWAPAARREDAGVALHELRIAAKRLRYTLELFRDVFGDAGSSQLARVKALQEELGELHDHDVRIGMVEDELANLAGEQATEVARSLWEADAVERPAVTASALRPPPDDPRRGLLSLLAREHDRRADRYRRFRTRWDEFAGEGMRTTLVALSARPIAVTANSRTEPATGEDERAPE